MSDVETICLTVIALASLGVLAMIFYMGFKGL